MWKEYTGITVYGVSDCAEWKGADLWQGYSDDPGKGAHETDDACIFATEEKLLAVLKKVNLYEFFQTQNGLDTMLDEQAANLSGGQKQRLCIARALLHDSALYIFDEATSNIDVESEEIILKLIRNLAREKTVIQITHRLANVADSDQIYMMEKGCVIEKGTQEELLEKQGAYADMYELQKALEQYREEAI